MASTTFIDNQTTIYADWLNDVNNTVYNGIFQSSSITSNSMICTGTASGAGFTNLINNTFSSPAPIGSVTPNSGAFTTLSAVTPNSGTTGGVQIKQSSTGGNSILQFLNSTGSTQWAYLSAGPGLDLNLQASGGITANGSAVTTISQFGYVNGSTSGYQRFPGGLTIQYGQYNSTITDNSPVSITLPVAFSTAFVSVTSNLIYNTPIGGTSAQATYNYITGLSTFNVFVGDTGTSGNVGFTWMAIGY